MRKKIVLAVTAAVLLSSCSTQGDTTTTETPGMVSISRPSTLEELPQETSRATVRLDGEEVDGINVSLTDFNGNTLAGGVTSRGVAVLPIDTRYLSSGVHRIIVEGRDIQQASVVSRSVVTEEDEAGRTAAAIAAQLTSEEAVSLLGSGDEGGLNRNATHTVRLELVQMYGIHNDQFIKIIEGDGVEKGNIKVTDLKYSVDGTTATFTTTDVSTLSMIGQSGIKPIKKENPEEPAPMVVTGKELQSSPVDAAFQGEAIAFEITRANPVLSVTAKV